MEEPEYVAIVPVKPPSLGKSRIVGLADADRRVLARAFALDTIAACRASSAVAQVLITTDDATFAAEPELVGCHAIPDGSASGLNAALTQAAAECRRRWERLTPVALCADLPALRPGDLTATLEAVVPGGASFVADAEGSGTSLYVAPYDDFAPRFGVDSCAAHLESGALEITHAPASVRRDVDDLDDLRRALALGVGRHTASVAERFVGDA